MDNASVFLENIQKVGKVASEKINKGLEEDTQIIVDNLKMYFLQIIDLKTSNPAKFKSLLVRPRFKKLADPENIPFNLSEEDDLSYGGIHVYCSVLFKIFKEAYENELLNTAQHTVTTIESILIELLKKGKDYLTIAQYFIDSLQRMNIRINQSPSKITVINHHVAYSWFFRLVFKDDFAIDGIDIAKITLFSSIREIINNDIDDIFISFVEYIHLGHYMPDFSLIPQLDFRTINHRDPKVRGYEKLSNEFIHNSCKALIYSDYLGSQKKLEEIRNSINELPDIDAAEKLTLISKHEEYAKKMFKYKSLQQVVIWLGTYCVYKKKYKFILELFDFNQPHDSASTWTSQDINPLDYAQILTLFLRKDQLESNIWYRWDGHSDYTVYHKIYLALLFVNAVFRNSLLHAWRNEIDIRDFIKDWNTDEISNSIYYTTEFQNIIGKIAKEDYFKSQFKLYSDSATKAIDILDSFVNIFQTEYNSKKTVETLQPDKIQLFCQTVSKFYSNGCSIKNIINYYKNVISSDENVDKEKCLFNSSRNSIPSSFFSPTPGTMFVGFEQNFAKQLIFNEDIYLTKILVNSCKISEEKIDQSTIVNFIEEHGVSENSVLIFVNIFPEYEIFNSKTEFTPRENITNNKLLEIFEFVGKYKNADVFYITDNRTKRNVIFLNRSLESGLGTIQMFKLNVSEDFISESNLYFRIIKYAENPSLKEDILNHPPLWLIQNKPKAIELSNYIDTLVNIEIKYLLKYDLPKDFEGWFIPLDN